MTYIYPAIQSNLILLQGSVDRELGNWPSGRHYSAMIEMNLLLFEDE